MGIKVFTTGTISLDASEVHRMRLRLPIGSRILRVQVETNGASAITLSGGHLWQQVSDLKEGFETVSFSGGGSVAAGTEIDGSLTLESERGIATLNAPEHWTATNASTAAAKMQLWVTVLTED